MTWTFWGRWKLFCRIDKLIILLSHDSSIGLVLLGGSNSDDESICILIIFLTVFDLLFLVIAEGTSDKSSSWINSICSTDCLAKLMIAIPTSSSSTTIAECIISDEICSFKNSINITFTWCNNQFLHWNNFFISSNLFTNQTDFSVFWALNHRHLLVHGKTTYEWHMDDIRVHMSDITLNVATRYNKALLSNYSGSQTL